MAHDGSVQIVADPEEIGWWIESADEETYGPASRATLRRFLEEGIISPNTLVRHCLHVDAKPVADQPGMMEGVRLSGRAGATDRLENSWPRKWRDQVKLAEATLPCSRHKNSAVLVCARCHAPYCNKCRQKPYAKQFFLCRYCQAGNHNRRFMALVLDSLLFITVPSWVFMAVTQARESPIIYLIYFVGNLVLFFRDSMFGGAGLGKRLAGLRVVQAEDGASPPTVGQGILRWTSQWIPIFNFVDAFAPLRDPLQRRYGDRWAKTRVVDTESRLAKARQQVAKRLAKKGVTLDPEIGMSQVEFARIAE